MSGPLRLVDRRPHLTGADLLRRLVPPRRFAPARFSTYLPDPEHPSQAAARSRDGAVHRGDLGAGKGVAVGPSTATTARSGAPARYLDGGYGVGKTHLLAAAWHEAPTPKAYLTFAELAGLIGFLGMEQAIARSPTIACSASTSSSSTTSRRP